MSIFRNLFGLAALALAGFAGSAQPLSYVYIQGDKQTPFYVKLDGEMQPRYGKNFSILSELVPGPVHLEILFQQNVYPAQKFTVMVPAGGNRGFLITRQGDGFALYDLQQHFYLNAGNAESDDHLPAATTVMNAAEAASGDAPHTAPPMPPAPTAVKQSQPKRTPKNIPHGKAAEQRPAKETVHANTAQTDNERFIDGVVLDNAHGAAPVTNAAINTTPATTAASQLPLIPNSDCPTPLSAERFSELYKGALDKGDDEARSAFLLDHLSECYASWQARTLATLFSTDAARFTLLQKIYPRITDQGAFPLLDDLLHDAVWKTAFDNLIHPNKK